MPFTVIIPARFGSTRLPGKPLLDIQGKPMLQRVWEQATCSAASRVVIATDDQRVLDVASAFGGEAILTAEHHPSGTDRLQEVVQALRMDPRAVVVNVQGDEPLIPPAVIDQVARNLAQSDGAGVATLCERIERIEDLTSPHVVKVVRDAAGMALYFSRAPVPWPRDAFHSTTAQMPAEGAWFRHIGIYAYRVGFLHKYVKWPAAPTEQLEKLEQLRALHQGTQIRVDEAMAAVPSGVDTQADLEQVRAVFAQRESV
tara:strand:+ start:17328 stop:18098 length:771 start_codon:yes stop_codon:yes gene_type:complete